MPIRHYSQVIVTLLSIAMIALLLWVAIYFRPSGDDLWGGHFLSVHGFWGMNWFQFTHWGGRYTSTFLSIAFMYLIGLKHYWASAWSLLLITPFAYYYLLLSVSRGVLSRFQLLSLTLTIMVLDIIAAKPNASGGADFVLVGQYFWNAGAYCYQTSIMLLCVILGSLARYSCSATPLKRHLYIIYIGIVLLCGTNEGTAIMLLLVSLYGLYRSFISGQHTWVWFWMAFLLLVNLCFLYFAPGVRVRMLYYSLNPSIFMYSGDWVLSTHLFLSQTAFMLVFYLLNPLFPLVAWLFYPQLRAVKARINELVPTADMVVLLLCLIMTGFFLTAFTMGQNAFPRYYSVMALLGVVLMLVGWTAVLEWGESRFNAVILCSKGVRVLLKWILAILLIGLLLVEHQRFASPISSSIQAIKQGPVFDRKFDAIMAKFEKASEAGQKAIDVSNIGMLPNVPILNYVFMLPQRNFTNKVTLKEQQQMMVANLGFFYGVTVVNLPSK